MPRSRIVNPLDLMVRRTDPVQLRRLFRAIDESFRAAFANSARQMKADREDRPGVYVRGAIRRLQLGEAFAKSATKSGLSASVLYNSNRSWCFPQVAFGAFKLTFAIVDQSVNYGARRLRCRGKYMQDHAAQNAPLNPQLKFLSFDPKVKRIIPNQSVGALVVVEPSLDTPSVPRYIGFWIPSPDLSRPFFRMRLDDLIKYLTKQIAAKGEKESATARKRRPALRRAQDRRKES